MSDVAERPPIVFLTIDSLRRDEVGCYGDRGVDYDLTPEIDSLAADGVRFDAAISNAPNTLFSFLATLTSTYPLAKKGNTAGRPAVAEELSDAGYRTAGFHSNPFLSRHYGFHRGFDVYHDFTDSSGDGDGDGGSSLTNRFFEVLNRTLHRSPLLHEYAKETKNYFTPPYTRAGPINDAATEHLRNADFDDPQFVWVHYMDAHHPYLPTGKYRELPFLPDISPIRTVDLAAKIDLVKHPEYDGARASVSERDVADLRALYRAQVKRTDDAVGEVVAELKRQGIYEEACIVVASDHGDEFLEHGSLGHSPQLYDELIHVPFIVKPPAEYDTVDAIEDLTAYLDIGPTFLDLAGTSAPDEMEGQSFLDALENGKTEREAVISEYANSGKRITSRRTPEWKYILDDYHDREELFDLTTDSTEQTDRSTDRPEVLESFRDAVRERMSHEEFDTDASFDDDVDEEMRQQLEDLGYL